MNKKLMTTQTIAITLFIIGVISLRLVDWKALMGVLLIIWSFRISDDYEDNE